MSSSKRFRIYARGLKPISENSNLLRRGSAGQPCFNGYPPRTFRTFMSAVWKPGPGIPSPATGFSQTTAFKSGLILSTARRRFSGSMENRAQVISVIQSYRSVCWLTCPRQIHLSFRHHRACTGAEGRFGGLFLLWARRSGARQIRPHGKSNPLSAPDPRPLPSSSRRENINV